MTVMLERAQIYSIIGQVLSRLADQGQALSVDQQLRLFTLLDQLPSSISVEQLGLIITPILAHTPEDQTNLYRWFGDAVLLGTSSSMSNQAVNAAANEAFHKADAIDNKSALGMSGPQVDETKPADTHSDKQTAGTYVAELQTFDKPPYVWTVELGAEREFTSADDLRQLVNRMHDRQLLDARELDLPRTIQTLVAQPGQINLQFKQLSQAPSYLLLIDQRAQNDHRAKIFNLLYAYLQFNEVQVSRYYFHADPKLCFNDDYPQGIPISQLYQQDRSARLLMLTYGYELFSPSTNDWSPWAKVFLQWKERAVLSPLPTKSWGAMEQKIAERFTLLPATPLGLATAIEEFKADEAQHWEDYLAQITDATTEPIYYQGNLIATLEQYYPDPVMRKWIAACALYPTLHWELTLHIGALLQKEYAHASLTSIEHLLELVRLPWFVEGRIPDQARDELVQWLEMIGEESRIRGLLLESLNRAPAPPDGSAAYADYRMHLVFNQWMLEDGEERKLELEKELSAFLEAGKLLEFVAVKRLERSARKTEFEVPDNWRKHLLNEFFNEQEQEQEEETETQSENKHADASIQQSSQDQKNDILERIKNGEYLGSRIREMLDTRLIEEDDLINSGIISKAGLEYFLNPPVFLDEQHNWNNLPPIKTNATDIYFLGIPASGKTCLLVGVLNYLHKKGLLKLGLANLAGMKYADALLHLTSSSNVGYVPPSTTSEGVIYIESEIYSDLAKPVLHPVNFFEMSGELFLTTYRDGTIAALTEYGRKTIGADGYLSNQNRKIIFLVLDYQEIINPMITQSMPKQYFMLSTVLKLLAMDGTLEKTDGLHILLTKSDLLPGGATNLAAAEMIIEQECKNLRRSIVMYKQQYNIHDSRIIPFSLGNFMLGQIFEYNPIFSENVCKAITSASFIKAKTWRRFFLGR